MHLKDGIGVKDGKFSYYVGSLEGLSQKKQHVGRGGGGGGRNYLKREAWTVSRFKGGGLAKKRAIHFM